MWIDTKEEIINLNNVNMIRPGDKDGYIYVWFIGETTGIHIKASYNRVKKEINEPDSVPVVIQNRPTVTI